MPRRQLPVYSPVTFSALLAGFRSALRGDPQGRLIEGVREILRSRYGARDVLFTDSGTSALGLAIGGATQLQGGAVGLPAYSCYDLSTAAEAAGSRVLLYDVDPHTLGPAAGALEEVASRRPAAVVAAHLMGYPVDVPAFEDVAGRALVIEDAAQGAGGRLAGKLLGSFGSLSVLSFGRGKGMTGGGGGALLAHDDRGEGVLRWARGRMPRDEGGRGVAKLLALTVQWAVGRPSLYWIPAALPFLHLGETVYHPPGSPRAMHVACLSLLQHLIGASDLEVSTRTVNAERLRASLDAREELHPIEPIPGARPGFLRFPILARDRALKRRLIDEGSKLGVSGMYPRTLARLPSLAPLLDYRGDDHSGATALAERLVSLPTHRFVGASDLAGLEALLKA